MLPQQKLQQKLLKIKAFSSRVGSVIVRVWSKDTNIHNYPLPNKSADPLFPDSDDMLLDVQGIACRRLIEIVAGLGRGRDGRTGPGSWRWTNGPGSRRRPCSRSRFRCSGWRTCGAGHGSGREAVRGTRGPAGKDKVHMTIWVELNAEGYEIIPTCPPQPSSFRSAVISKYLIINKNRNLGVLFRCPEILVLTDRQPLTCHAKCPGPK